MIGRSVDNGSERMQKKVVVA